MKKLTIGTEVFLVGDAIADAVVEYAVALSESGAADQVDLFDASSGAHVIVVLSAGVAVACRPAAAEGLVEPDDGDSLAYIEGRLALHVDAAPTVPDEAPTGTALDAERWFKRPE